MVLKNSTKKLCLFYILILFLWGTVSATTSASEMADYICSAQERYVNHSSSIVPLGKTFPSQEYLSLRNTGTQETVSVAKGRNIRPLPRSVRNITALLSFHNLFSNTSVFSGRFTGQEIPSHSFCGIIITNYIHAQDGQKI